MDISKIKYSTRKKQVNNYAAFPKKIKRRGREKVRRREIEKVKERKNIERKRKKEKEKTKEKEKECFIADFKQGE